jgi:hypothetical protein
MSDLHFTEEGQTCALLTVLLCITCLPRRFNFWSKIKRPDGRTDNQVHIIIPAYKKETKAATQKAPLTFKR